LRLSQKPEKTLSADKRSSTRHDVLIDATLIVEGEEASEEIQNLSLGGALITCSRSTPMGARVELQFRIPTHEDVIRTGAQVRWLVEGKIGIQFDGLRAKEVWALNKYFEGLSG